MANNVIKQVVKTGEYGTQDIKLIVREAERGKQGEQGEEGKAATIKAGNAYSVNPEVGPAVVNTGTASDATFDFYIPRGEKGEPGKDGYYQYTAGVGIKIEDGKISALGSGGGMNVWGLIEGNIADQADLAPYIQQVAPKAIWYGTSETAGNEKVQAVTTTNGDFEFEAGNVLMVRFRNNNSGYSGTSTPMQLAVDGQTAVSILDIDTVGGGSWHDFEVVIFVCGYIDPSVPTSKRFIAVGKQPASTTIYGPTKLYNGHDSSSTSLAATANSVKQVYDAIPTVNNATLTINQNGSTIGTFTANASTNTTVAINTPTITMTSTDPGEGQPLAANNFIAVYSEE